MAARFTFDVDHMVGRREIELRVTYSVTPGRPARLYGDYPHPAEDPEVELISVKHGGKDIALSDAEEDALLQMAIERAGEDLAEEAAEAAEWRAQSRRDAMLMEGWGGY